MNGLKEMLMQEKNRLEYILSLVKEDAKSELAGTLQISKNKGRVRYYHNTPNGIEYIPKTEKEMARQLAQKTYDMGVREHAKKRLKQISRILLDYSDDEIERLYTSLNSERHLLISPIEETWEQQLNKWTQEEYIGKGFQEGTPLIYSERGERVRSKSEKILADYFYRKNIPYKYEKPLLLKGYGTVYPDFTFLSKRMGKEIYWEHEGRMDNPEYVRTAIKKIQTYEDNGIYVGDRLILTFETETTILNTKDIERNVKRYLI